MRVNYFEVIEASPDWNERQIANHVRSFSKVEAPVKQEAMRKLLNPQERMNQELKTFHAPDYSAETPEAERFSGFLDYLLCNRDFVRTISPNLAYYLYGRLVQHPLFATLGSNKNGNLSVYENILRDLDKDVWISHSLALLYERCALFSEEVNSTDDALRLWDQAILYWMNVLSDKEFFKGKVKTGFTGDYEEVFVFLGKVGAILGNVERLLLYEAGKFDAYFYELKTSKSFEIAVKKIKDFKALEKKLVDAGKNSTQQFIIEQAIKDSYDRVRDLAIECANSSKFRMAIEFFRALPPDRLIPVGQEKKGIYEVISMMESWAINSGDYWRPESTAPKPPAHQPAQKPVARQKTPEAPKPSKPQPWGSPLADHSGLTDVKSISVGEEHSAVLRNDGIVEALGYNEFGSCKVPPGLVNVKAISVGRFHTLALKKDGTVVAWGYNAAGQAKVPKGLKGVKAIAAGGEHSVALKEDGTIVVWGDKYGLDIPEILKN